ncbi:MAG: spore coat protein [Treponema sp.]|nr:spore coat protein [Treponema sp.]
MTALILQGRLDSSRLPGKSLLPLGGAPLILRVMEAFSSSPSPSQGWDTKILACPLSCIPSFAPLAEKAGFLIVGGSEDDVLSRYCLAARQAGADRIIRATGDNPFVFVDAALAIHQEGMDLGADYAGYSGLPHGAGVEALKTEALFKAEREAQDPYEREHVSPYLYRNPEQFLLHRPAAPKKWQAPDLRITVDTQEDLAWANLLYGELDKSEAPERNRSETLISIARNLHG